MNSKPPVNSQPHINNLESIGHRNNAALDASFCSALFPALDPDQKENRRFLKEETIFSIGSLTVVFTGLQFDQSDFDVYLALLAIAQPLPPVTAVKFHAASLLQKLGMPTGESDLEQFDSVLIRLCGGVIEITDHKKRYFGSLIEGGKMDEVTMIYQVSMNKQFRMLFGEENLSQSSNVVCESLFAKLKGCQ
ncbi:hypothetical protein JCM14076_32490 [Methylosoma difficile]